MKKALLYGLSAVMLLSLTACGAARAERPDPVQSPEQSGGIEGYITRSPQDEGEDDSTGVINTSSKDEAQEISATELYTIFEQGYQGGQIYVEFGLSEDELILMEIGEVGSILGVRTDVKAPVDLESQYRAWRAEAHPATSTQAPPEETQSSTGGQQSKPVGGTQQTGVGGGSTTHTQPPKVTNQGSSNDDNDTDPFLIPAGGTMPGYRDPSEDQSTTDAGYLPEDPNDYIYGN